MSSLHINQHPHNRQRSNRTTPNHHGKGTQNKFMKKKIFSVLTHNLVLVVTEEDVLSHQITTGQPPDSQNISQSSTIQHSSRYVQSQPPNPGPIHTITQPYGTENSNFGPFYHHHNHISAGYSSPYDKFKIPSNAHSRTSTSPYGSYQGFYGSGHHHQLARPNGYIDLVPR